ncbi:homoserine/homoserine lactone efflux protein [Clostridium ragsdalei P11]|uniref:Homoserine/homoserine lactone efflux protein n=1 Tax=Clostridium ragsdalei P11 TaxID=1353534 RepID=A0A1A6B3D2_9CLOT|nr:LysE family translocator [Clostridium ragsdalei]OBR96807.1 homoserine/homoserine lactone efflux protein [Clostridium ragsdalei P11]
MNTFSFLITSFIIILIPGTGVTYTISTGIIKGKRASIFAALGCTMGIIPHLCVSIALSSFLMKMNNKAFLVLKLIGAIYLLYLGIGMIRSKTSFELTNSKSENKVSTIIRSGILINLLNPKLTLFFFSFLPQYAKSTSNNYMAECLLYGFAFMILTLLVFIGYGLLAGVTNKFFINSPKRISLLQKIFGIIFIVFAIQLAFSSI